MIRRPNHLIPTLLVLLVFGCASSSGTARSPQEIARLSYVDASLTYEVTMRTVSDLRAAHLITDQQWSRITVAQVVVRTWAPRVRGALDLWATSGREPAEYAEAIGKLLGAFVELKAVKAEVVGP